MSTGMLKCCTLRLRAREYVGQWREYICLCESSDEGRPHRKHGCEPYMCGIVWWLRAIGVRRLAVASPLYIILNWCVRI